MRNFIQTLVSRTLLMALPVVFVPSVLSAQAAQQTQCEAEFMPAEIPAGEAAVQVTAELSEQVGIIGNVQAAGESGLAMASPDDIPRTELAAGEETPRPITMSSEGASATLWLNSEQAQEGTYQLTLQGDAGSCTAELTVTGGGAAN